ncbi:MAG: YceI family protein [Burkholderiales bacterium]|nr:YceI family protein [Burkholderiales bacterium]
MKKLLLALVAVSGLAYAETTTYTLDPTHSSVEYHYNHIGFSNPSGKWLANGSLQLDDKKLANSSANITIQIESIVTGIPILDEHLKGADFFDIAQYPTATFVSSKVTKIKGKTFDLVGNLTLHGVTKPVTLHVTENAHKVNPISKLDTVGYSATATIKRSDFGLAAYVPAVSDEVRLNIELEAAKADKQ